MKDKYVFREQFKNFLYVFVTFLVMVIEWKILVWTSRYTFMGDVNENYWVIGIVILVGTMIGAFVSVAIVNRLYKRLF